jgi:hypothetical protein
LNIDQNSNGRTQTGFRRDRLDEEKNRKASLYLCANQDQDEHVSRYYF